MGWFVDFITYVVALFGFNRGLDLLRSPLSDNEINAFVILGFGQYAWAGAAIISTLFLFAATINPHRHLLFYYTAPVIVMLVFGALFVVMFWGFITMGSPYTGTRFITPPLGIALGATIVFRYQLQELPRQILGPFQRRSEDARIPADEDAE